MIPKREICVLAWILASGILKSRITYVPLAFFINRYSKILVGVETDKESNEQYKYAGPVGLQYLSHDWI